MPGKFIFTITTGRSGTAYLAELLRANLTDAEAHHEILGYNSFGIDTPDISDLMQFNAFGNTAKVRAFWKQKLDRIAAKPTAVYAETSHLLAKAGLLENIGPLTEGSEVCIVLLQRDVVKVVTSLGARHDFVNKGNMWLWYLDPDYPRKIIDSHSFKQLGLTGLRLWYVYEMMARAEYYRILLANVPGIRFVEAMTKELNRAEGVSAFLARLGCHRPPAEIRIPPKQNANATQLHQSSVEAVRQIVQRAPFAPRDLAQQYIDSGQRLAEFCDWSNSIRENSESRTNDEPCGYAWPPDSPANGGNEMVPFQQ